MLYIKKLRLVALLSVFVVCNSFAQTSNPQQYKYIFTVAKDGSGDYRNIQDAIDAMRVYPLGPITLFIKNGTYHEKILLPSDNVDVSFIGESVDSTIISFDDYSGKGKHTTFTSYTAKISGNRFTAENITFSNTAGKVGQALALYVDADKAVFRNCRFLGNQDTIFASGEDAGQLFEDCYIEGTTDYIFGPSTAVFNRCTIFCKSNSYITAANTSKGKAFGFVFLDCKIVADTSVNKFFLGRPWRAHSKTVFIRCEIPSQLAAAGWNNWGNPENEKTVFYAEYRNKGEGAQTKGRVNWSRQLSDKEAKLYTLANIFSSLLKKGEQHFAWYAKTSTTTFNHAVFTGMKPSVINLYPGAVPNSTHIADRENFTIKEDNVLRVAKVSIPTLTVFTPQKPNGTSIIICPGGGYSILAFDKEGTKVAEEMNRWGVTAFVLKYRLPDDSFNIDKSLAPLQDAQQAVRYIRAHAKDFGIKTNKIGIMGFSAGGHLASTAATHFNYNADIENTDTTSVRPDFAVLIYPVISFDSSITHRGSKNNLVGVNATSAKVRFFSNELQVNEKTPPSFLVHAGDDKAVPVENSIRYYQACVQYNVPAEIHIYPKGGHGFGMNNKTTSDNWLERLQNWLNGLK